MPGLPQISHLQYAALSLLRPLPHNKWMKAQEFRSKLQETWAIEFNYDNLFYQSITRMVQAGYMERIAQRGHEGSSLKITAKGRQNLKIVDAFYKKSPTAK